jgi:hypothetical protein
MTRALDQGRFTVAVFQDTDWARRGLEALLADRFVREAITILALDTPASTALIASVLDAPDRITMNPLGAVVARGPLLAALQGADEGLAARGLAATIGRAGFQPHDGYIFETLVGRGGVLVAVRSEPRAADALARLHSYGGGNAAIGAWTGRL